MPYLFLFHIGPVQSFIASARRTRDLWFGSQLLSDLSWTAAAYIADTYTHEALIFPSFEKPEELRSLEAERNVSNKIVALLEPKEDGAKFAQEVKQATIQRLDKIKKQLYQELGDVSFHDKVMDKQLEDCLEFFWVALPFPYQGNSDYSEVRKRLEALMAARKATYTYQPVSWGSTQHKSSITGTLESVIPQGIYTQPEQQRISKLFEIFRAGPAEHLSGIDLLKRRGKFSDREDAQAYFLSTSHIAAQPYLERLELLEQDPKVAMQKVKNAWITYHNHLKNKLPTLRHENVPNQNKTLEHSIIGFADGALLFEEHLTEHANKNADVLQKATDYLHTFKSEVDIACGQKLVIDPYYAIVVADGDRIGEIIDTLAKQAGGYHNHQRFSQKLALFAGEAKQIVRKYQGTPIYTGGDDVLALVPLHKLLECTKQLAETFQKTLAPALNDIDPPTLSMGVAIVHHLSLLQESLGLARRAERLAKGVDKKNALAILISKRSGEQSIIKGPRVQVTAALEQYIKYYREGVIPYGLAYELRTMYQLLLPIEQKLSDELKEIIWSNTKRILKRKLDLPGSKVRQTSSSQPKTDEEKKAQDSQAKQILLTLLKPIEGRPEHDHLFENMVVDKKDKPVPLPEFINELLIARELAEAMQLAKIVIEPQATKGIDA
ncbi:type III-B CRISPR-associated protein Cas10/Cmr2 [Dictyobacter arantiisoli]|uniref:Type III-B CRISPR-associated protein Cas10/Cmr2 n=1 Tax=Dictyobacter arantiisoli TaxID=2014874 RepID=A0A5A5TG43_9CHLR|nr:type III-B CRISPR-associated protein Cas10/Cmr2 [Dictyobacter arantiisoli]GCF10228.1 type III-B CRISPR-associated protein Cas10/Cmr2 [Dictyobacter arantiisoli]